MAEQRQINNPVFKSTAVFFFSALFCLFGVRSMALPCWLPGQNELSLSQELAEENESSAIDKKTNELKKLPEVMLLIGQSVFVFFEPTKKESSQTTNFSVIEYTSLTSIPEPLGSQAPPLLPSYH